MPERPTYTAAVDLPAAAYPFTIRAHRHSDDECVWSATVTGAKALQVPPLKGEHGPVYIIVEYADGSTERADF